MKKRYLSVLLVLLLFSCAGREKRNAVIFIDKQQNRKEILRRAAQVRPSERQLRWQRLELIAFIHFGMNTFTDREWGDGSEDPTLFNPTELNADQWVGTLKKAGFKQVILTAKHHDGFCLWPTRYTNHSVASSPWKEGRGDVVREVAEACQKQGLGFGVYLSPWDRYEPFYGDSPTYNRFFLNQLRELLTQYGPIDEVWFDGACAEGPNGKRQIYDWKAYYQLVRRLQPQAVIAIMGPDVRWVGTETGYGRETEWSVIPLEPPPLQQTVPFTQEMLDGAFIQKDRTQYDLGGGEKILQSTALFWYPSEVDVSIRPGWFYHASQDEAVKTPEKLLDIYFSSVGRNSVLLLNVPPDRRGLIHENDAAALAGFRKRLDEMFGSNLAADANIVASSFALGRPPLHLLDGKLDTHWLCNEGTMNPLLEIFLPEKRTVNILSLQEAIELGQRVEKFRLDARVGRKWVTVAQGTTIGYKRLIRFKTITSSHFRLCLEQYRDWPALAELGFYHADPKFLQTSSGR